MPPPITDEDREKEVLRIVAAKDQFDTLGLDFKTCEVSDVNKVFRGIARLVHSDKCTHPKANDAFDKARQAHQLLSDEKVLAQFKAAQLRKEEREAEQRGGIGIGKQFAGQRKAGGTGEHDISRGAAERREEGVKREREEAYLEAVRAEKERRQRRDARQRELQRNAVLDEALEPQRGEWRSFAKEFSGSSSTTGGASDPAARNNQQKAPSHGHGGGSGNCGGTSGAGSAADATPPPVQSSTTASAPAAGRGRRKTSSIIT